jgi:hypothetical protein
MLSPLVFIPDGLSIITINLHMTSEPIIRFEKLRMAHTDMDEDCQEVGS